MSKNRRPPFRTTIYMLRVLNNHGDRQEALRHLECARQMRIGTLRYHVYYVIAYVHYHEKRLPEALDAAEEVWKLSEPDNNLVAQAQISSILVMILFSANRVTEAWKYMEIF